MKLHLLPTAVLLALLPSCATETPRGPQGTFSVKVVPDFGKNVPVRIAAYTRKDGQRGPDLKAHLVTGDGVTGFVLPLNQVYGVRAYADLNRDGRVSPDEPAASLEGLKPVADPNAAHEPVILTLPGAGAAQASAEEAGSTVAPTGTPANGNVQKGLDMLRNAAPGGTLPKDVTPDKAQQGIDKLREAAPNLPIPPLPVPPPP